MAQTITKKLYIGTLLYAPYREHIPTAIHCTIEFTSFGKLSIMGAIGPKHNPYTVGQIESEFEHRDPTMNDARYTPISVSDIAFSEGWTPDLWYGFLAIWHDWHNNDMRPYCQHQKIMGWHTERINKNKPSTAYERFYNDQLSWNLKGWIPEPQGYLSKPCPVCGYRYGTAWKTETVPDYVIEFLCALPSAK